MSCNYRLLTCVVFTFLIAVQTSAVETRTRDFIPAGTILHCTMDEPNFSAKTANVGDPVLCHLGPLGAFGHSIFPRGAELGGHLQDYTKPGHFFGKGSITIEFDRLILPNTDVLPLAAKVTSAPHLNVDAQGQIHGKGHPKRDTFFWAIPLFWPVKVFTLPLRGPYPALKGENRLSLRLMEDVEVPLAPAAAQTTVQNFVPSPPMQNLPWNSERKMDSRMTAPSIYQPTSIQPASNQPSSNMPRVTPAVQRIAFRNAEAGNGSVTILALQSGSTILAREYWLQGNKVAFVTVLGVLEDVPLNAMDLVQTVRVNQARNVEFALHLGRMVEQ
jgi:hypothetical protein